MTISSYLHFYMCKNCKQTAVSPVRYLYREICCVGCNSWLSFMWSEPITTDEQRALADRCLVYNPGTSQESDLLPQGKR